MVNLTYHVSHFFSAFFSMTESIKENRKFIIEDISNGLERFPISLIYDEIKEFEELRNIFYKVKDTHIYTHIIR